MGVSYIHLIRLHTIPRPLTLFTCRYIGLATHGQQRLYMFWTDQENGQVVGFDVDDGSLKIVIPSVDTQCLKLARVVGFSCFF